MTHRTLPMFLALTMVLAAAACQQERQPVRIGVKDFTEQKIIAQMASALTQNKGMGKAQLVPCQDTYQCQHMLRTGRIDLMTEYTGTGLLYLGQPVNPQDASLEHVRKLYKPLGLSWMGALGFDNGYLLLVTPQRAASLGLKTIEDLEKLPEGVRVACPSTYLKRPSDGLGPLVERHGLRLRGQPIALDTIEERIDALLDGRADAIVVYGTDGAISELDLVALKDSLGFFPPYQAAFVMHAKAAQTHPELAQTLQALEGRLDAATMRQLNHQAEAQGADPKDVAAGFLSTSGLIDQDNAPTTTRSELTIAADTIEVNGPLGPKALRAVRRAFPGRPVAFKAQPDPLKAVTEGKARLALVGAEHFFTDQGRQDKAQAAAVVGSRLIHVVHRAGAPPENWLNGKIGTLGAKGQPSRVLRPLLGDNAPAFQAKTTAALLDALKSSSIDTALIALPASDPELTKAMASGALELGTLEGWMTPQRAIEHPFLRPRRIPANTYPKQPQAIETLGSQVVLAAPAYLPEATPSGGPASALLTTGTPLTDAEIQALAKATNVPTAPDSALPSAWSRRAPEQPQDTADSTAQKVLSTVLNILAIAFLALLAGLVLPTTPKDPAPQPPAEA